MLLIYKHKTWGPSCL